MKCCLLLVMFLLMLPPLSFPSVFCFLFITFPTDLLSILLWRILHFTSLHANIQYSEVPLSVVNMF